MEIHQYRSYPLKGLYLTSELTTTLFFRLPYWVLGYLRSTSRPRPSWSLSKSVLIKLIDHFNVVEMRHAVSY